MAAGLVTGFALVLLAGPVRAADDASGGVDAVALWKKNCQSCHGPDGKGDTKAGKKAGVKDLTSAEVRGELDKAKAVKTITDGVQKEDSDKMAMKAFAEKLSKAEIDALADHVMALK